MTSENSKSATGLLAGFSEGYLADVGRVILGWSHVEQQFDLMFLSAVVMLGASSGSMSNPRVKLLGDLSLAESSLKKIDRILSQLRKLRTERDELAHIMLGPEPGGRDASQSRAIGFFKSWKNQKPVEQRRIPQQRIRKTFERIDALHWDLVDLRLQRPW